MAAEYAATASPPRSPSLFLAPYWAAALTSAEESAQAMAWMRLTEMPTNSAAVSCAATARMAMPMRENRKNAQAAAMQTASAAIDINCAA